MKPQRDKDPGASAIRPHFSPDASLLSGPCFSQGLFMPREAGPDTAELRFHVGPLELSQLGGAEQARSIRLAPGRTGSEQPPRYAVETPVPQHAGARRNSTSGQKLPDLGTLPEARLVGQHPNR